MLRYTRVMLLVGALALALPAVGCGESDDSPDPATSESQQDNAQDTARTKLEQCLREQGLDLPDPSGGDGASRFSEADRQKFQEAIQGPCAEFRDDAIGDISPEEQQELQDARVKFQACMRDQGIDIGSGGGGGLSQIDPDDPDVQAAIDKCGDLPSLPGLGGGG